MVGEPSGQNKSRRVNTCNLSYVLVIGSVQSATTLTFNYTPVHDRFQATTRRKRWLCGTALISPCQQAGNSNYISKSPLLTNSDAESRRCIFCGCSTSKVPGNVEHTVVYTEVVDKHTVPIHHSRKEKLAIFFRINNSSILAEGNIGVSAETRRFPLYLDIIELDMCVHNFGAEVRKVESVCEVLCYRVCRIHSNALHYFGAGEARVCRQNGSDIATT